MGYMGILSFLPKAIFYLLKGDYYIIPLFQGGGPPNLYVSLLAKQPVAFVLKNTIRVLTV